MQELLSRPEDLKGPLRDQEFYELRLFDPESAGERVYCVREAITEKGFIHSDNTDQLVLCATLSGSVQASSPYLLPDHLSDWTNSGAQVTTTDSICSLWWRHATPPATARKPGHMLALELDRD